MRHGGTRRGAGRPARSTSKRRKRSFATRDLLERLRGLKHRPSQTDEGLRDRRVVVALAALGATGEEISAVLKIPVADIHRRFDDEIFLGEFSCRLSANVMLRRAALGRGRRPSISALIYLARRWEREERAAHG